MGRARSVTNNHLSETIQLMTKARLGGVPEPDFVLWPENSTDIDPTVDPLTKLTVQAAADVADRPILVGAVMQGPGMTNARPQPCGGIQSAECWLAMTNRIWSRSVSGFPSVLSYCR